TTPVRTRLAAQSDVSLLFELIHALAEYEKLAHEVVGSVDALADHLFGDRPCIQAFIAEHQHHPLGFALFFPIYITATAQAGFYLEDLFVKPEARGQGVGKALLARLAQHALEQSDGTLEWSVLDWNAPAIAFYQRIGASISEQDRVCRLTHHPLQSVSTLTIPSDWTVRFATMDDSLAIAECLDDPDNLSEAKHLFEQWLTPPLAHESALCAHLEVAVVAHGDRIVGCAPVSQSYSTFLTQPGFLIERVVVVPGYSYESVSQVLVAYLAKVALERYYGRLEWRETLHRPQAIAQAHQLGATVLDDWRICRGSGEAIAQHTSHH
ncbi:MAG TPA: N-acetyltransferase family protein, partial [Elainellaceae cyanobacterium]